MSKNIHFQDDIDFTLEGIARSLLKLEFIIIIMIISDRLAVSTSMMVEIVEIRTMRSWEIWKWDTIETETDNRQGVIFRFEVTNVHGLTD